ncbi:hypothetical protein J8273_1155 [Carpediemonas membranifera]|uniref:GAR domain-containing protein n=1 Tax=Carpediemonas membranifera TaxID=201153 RepID=A0A8J6EBH9_9EUKA|nr:hypothetical protein J8273_1155 [Carpediemonas membranifera]|eukprot:KAG9397240.1 hypothetical protein J8273_1155 [Carpediemonas membranifera]
MEEQDFVEDIVTHQIDDEMSNPPEMDMEYTAEQQIEELLVKLEASEMENSQLRSEMETLTEDRRHLSTVVDEMQNAMIEMETLYTNSQDLEDLKEALQSREDHIKELEGTLDDCYQKIGDLESQLAEINKDGDRVQELAAEYEAVQRNLMSIAVETERQSTDAALARITKEVVAEATSAAEERMAADEDLQRDIREEHTIVHTSVDALFDESGTRALTREQVMAARADLQRYSALIRAATKQIGHEQSRLAELDKAHVAVQEGMQTVYAESVERLRGDFEKRLDDARHHYLGKLNEAEAAAELAQLRAKEATSQTRTVVDGVAEAKAQMKMIEDVSMVIRTENNCIMQGLGTVAGPVPASMFGKLRGPASVGRGSGKKMPTPPGEVERALRVMTRRLEENGFTVQVKHLHDDRWRVGKKTVILKLMNGVLKVSVGGGWVSLVDHMRHHTKDYLQ